MVRLDLKMKTANVLHVLTKQILSMKDIFLLMNRVQLVTNHVTITFWNRSKKVLQYHQSITMMLCGLKFQM